MIHLDEDLLICDLAETYHIYDYRGLSPSLVAVLCNGLGYDSRIKKKLANRETDISDFLMAAILDRVSLIVWSKSKSGTKKPESVLELLEPGLKKRQLYSGYDDYEEYERRRSEIMRG